MSQAAGCPIPRSRMLLGLRSGVEHKHVPYRGTVPGITDLVGGQIPSTLNPSGEYLSHARAGKLRFPEKYGELYT